MSDSEMTPTHFLAQYYDAITGPIGPGGTRTNLLADAVQVIENGGAFDVALVLHRGVDRDDAERLAGAAMVGLRKILGELRAALDS